MSALTLPGTLPGLLRRGAPVIVDGCMAGTVWAVGSDILGGHGALVTTGAGVITRALAELQLDLDDPIGRDIAARWLAALLESAP